MNTDEYPIIRRRDERKKTVSPWRVLFSAIFFLLAASAIGYGAFVHAANSGTGFYLVWIGAGAFLLLLGFVTAGNLRRKVPMVLRIIFAALVAAGIILVAVTWSLILPHFSDTGKPGADAVIVLGAQVRKSGPSTILKYRLDAAAAYLKENPDAVCIVSGAQGSNEPLRKRRG